MDFRGSLSTQSAINEWVSEVSEGRIPDLLDAPPAPDTDMLLVNAMSLQSRLLNPFDPEQTFDKGIFFLQNGRRLEVPMMAGKFDLPMGYSPELECRVLEIPFTQRRISMFVLLPDDAKDGIHRLDGNATSENLKLIISTLEKESVTVKIPRFKVSDNVDVRKPLQSMGLIDIFGTDTSDLSLLAPEGGLSLSAIKHKVTYELTEKGAHGVVSQPQRPRDSLSSLRRQNYFEVDHPFMFLIWDYYTGMILLMGRVMHPEVPVNADRSSS